jgi:hypothetical protein
VTPKFINAVYFEGRILVFEEHGDVYEYEPHSPAWRLLSVSPWPERRLYSTVANIVCELCNGASGRGLGDPCPRCKGTGVEP